jgi:hypothetical protein
MRASDAGAGGADIQSLGQFDKFDAQSVRAA